MCSLESNALHLTIAALYILGKLPSTGSLKALPFFFFFLVVMGLVLMADPVSRSTSPFL
jgi:hypothetical protein